MLNRLQTWLAQPAFPRTWWTAPPFHTGLQGEHNDTLGLLAAHLCFQRDLLPRLFASLGASLSSDGGEAAGRATLAAGALQPTMAQAALLGLLCEEAQDMPQAQG